MGKLELLKKILSSSVIEEEVLRKIGNTGIPHKCRTVAYKVLLGVLGRNISFHKKQEETHLKKYNSYFKIDSAGTDAYFIRKENDEAQPNIAKTTSSMTFEIKKNASKIKALSLVSNNNKLTEDNTNQCVAKNNNVTVINNNNTNKAAYSKEIINKANEHINENTNNTRLTHTAHKQSNRIPDNSLLNYDYNEDKLENRGNIEESIPRESLSLVTYDNKEDKHINNEYTKETKSLVTYDKKEGKLLNNGKQESTTKECFKERLNDEYNLLNKENIEKSAPKEYFPAVISDNKEDKLLNKEHVDESTTNESSPIVTYDNKDDKLLNKENTEESTTKESHPIDTYDNKEGKMLNKESIDERTTNKSYPIATYDNKDDKLLNKENTEESTPKEDFPAVIYDNNEGKMLINEYIDERDTKKRSPIVTYDNKDDKLLNMEKSEEQYQCNKDLNENKRTLDSLNSNSYNTSDITDEVNQLDTNSLVLSLSLSQRTIHQINIDIERIKIEHRIYKNKDYSYIYQNILMITAVQRPLTEYIQGMGDLIIPFFHLFMEEDEVSPMLEIECSIYQCFQKVMFQIEKNLQFMQTQAFTKILKILKKFDVKLFNFFEEQNICISMFGIRWLHCLFIREFSLDNWFRLFDSMVSTDIPNFLIYFSVALLKLLRSKLLSLDSCEAILLLQTLKDQNISYSDIEYMIGEVNYMRSVYVEDSSSESY